MEKVFNRDWLGMAVNREHEDWISKQFESMNLIDEVALIEVIRWFDQKTCDCIGCTAKAKDLKVQQAKLKKVLNEIRKALPRN